MAYPPMTTCYECGGTGKVIAPYAFEHECPNCHGDGETCIGCDMPRDYCQCEDYGDDDDWQ